MEACLEFYLGDELCDGINNREECDYDGGDCCLEAANCDLCTGDSCLCHETGQANCIGDNGKTIDRMKY